MRGFPGGVALALLLAGSPLAAQDAVERQPSAAERPAPATAGQEVPPAAPSPGKDAPAPASASPAAATGAPAAAPVADLTPPPPPPPPPITLVLNTDLGAQRLTVIENGKAKYAWPISSGRSGYPTPTGTFRPQWASRMWYSRQYEYAPMPHAVFFHRGTAFHGTGAVGLLGRPASHGCVRLAPGNAALLFKLVHKHGYASTKVVVHGGSRGKAPAVARRGSRSELASARPAPRAGTRVSRHNARRSSWAD